MPGTAGWAKLGDALAGNSELEYEKGLSLGANTENALAQASERRSKAKAQMDLSEQLKAAGFKPQIADASAGALTAGAGLGDVIAMAGKQQEQDFRATAGDPTIPFSDRQVALQGVSSGPVERFAAAGPGLVQDKFSDATAPTVSPIGQADINKTNAEAGLTNAKREHPADFRASGRKVTMVGGVPYMEENGELVRKLSPEEVAANVGEITNERNRGANAAKAEGQLPAAYAKYRSAVDNADSVIGKTDEVLKNIDWTNAGPSAWLSRGTPGTPAFALDQTVQSIKANAGFQQLSQMRHESPTGGALGNVTEKELQFLQSALASMDTAQDPKQLAKAVADVRDHYTRYKEYAAQDYEIAQERAKYKPTGGQGNPSAENPHPLADPHTPGAAPKPSNSAPRTFTTEAEAEAAGLPDGTPVIINGVSGKWVN